MKGIRIVLRLAIIAVVAWKMAQLGAAMAHYYLDTGGNMMSTASDPSERYLESWTISSFDGAAPGSFHGAEWSDDKGLVSAAGEEQEAGFYFSPILTATRPVSAAVIEWRGSDPVVHHVHVSLRWITSDGWSEWTDFVMDDDMPAEGVTFSTPLMVPGAQTLQWRAQLEEGSAITSFTLGSLAVDSGLDAQTLTSKAVPLPNGGPLVIERSEWGSNQGAVTWKPEPNRPRAIVVHHTATSSGGSNPAAVVRAIDTYHRVTRDWGDIGYHYLIDQDGRIYAGRKGGPDSVAAHAYNFNEGTIGIAILGNFEKSSPSPQARESLIALTAYLNRQYGINPQGSTRFYNRAYPTLMGHRDTGRKTTCPGANLADELPQLRGWVADRMAGAQPLLPPGIQLAPSSEWVRGMITVSLSPANEFSGQLSVQLDGAEMYSQDAPLTFTMDSVTLADGSHTIEAFAREGSRSARSSVSFHVDNNTPSILWVAPPTEEGVTMVFEDTTSDISGIALRRRDVVGNWSAWEEVVGAFPAPRVERMALFQGATALQWQAHDEAGNFIESGIVESPSTVLPDFPGTSGRANLAIEKLQTFPARGVAGQPLGLQALVVNRGDWPTAAATIAQLLLDGVPVASWRIPEALPAGAVVLLRTDEEMLPGSTYEGSLAAGTYHLEGVVDPAPAGERGAVIESNENDNRTGPVTLQIASTVRSGWQEWIAGVGRQFLNLWHTSSKE